MAPSTRSRSASVLSSQPSPRRSSRSKFRQVAPQGLRRSTRQQSSQPTPPSNYKDAAGRPLNPRRKGKAGHPKVPEVRLGTVPEDEEEERQATQASYTETASDGLFVTDNAHTDGQAPTFRPTPNQIRGSRKILKDLSRQSIARAEALASNGEQEQAEIDDQLDGHRPGASPNGEEEEEEGQEDERVKEEHREGDEEMELPPAQGEEYDVSGNVEAENDVQGVAGDQAADCLKPAARKPKRNKASEGDFQPGEPSSSETHQKQALPRFETSHTGAPEVLRRSREQARGVVPGLKRAFIAEQPDATSVEWDGDSQPTSSPPHRDRPTQSRDSSAEHAGVAARSSSPHRVTQEVTSDVDPSEDGGFVECQRDYRKTDRKREVAKAVQSRHIASKRQAPDSSTESPNKRRRIAKRSVQPSRDEDDQARSQPQTASRASGYTDVQQVAKSARLFKDAPVQVRKQWTDEEVEAIMEGIARYKCRYSAIKTWDMDKNGHVLRDRTQVNLKDKARNMKVTYLV